MNGSGPKKPEAPGPNREEASREEQGDLLADAVLGAFSGGRGPDRDESLVQDDAESRIAPTSSVEERPPVQGVAPKKAEDDQPPAVETEEDQPTDVEPIPDSPWEQKMAWAKERAGTGRQEEAEGLYRELIEEDPFNVRALNNLGVLLDEGGDPEGAATYLATAHKLDPQNQEVMANLGAALGALGRYGEAEDILRQAFRLDPSNLEARANLGILLHRRGLYAEAETELGAVCAASPENGTAFFYRGEALNRLGRVDEAIEALERVIELLPGNHRAHYTLGVLFDKKDLPEKAALMYRKSRELTKQ